jgi:hypothetical protein
MWNSRQILRPKQALGLAHRPVSEKSSNNVLSSSRPLTVLHDYVYDYPHILSVALHSDIRRQQAKCPAWSSVCGRPQFIMHCVEINDPRAVLLFTCSVDACLLNSLHTAYSFTARFLIPARYLQSFIPKGTKIFLYIWQFNYRGSQIF